LRGTDSVSRRTIKYAKTLAQVGRGGPRAFSRPAGQPLEFMPATDPAGLRVGDTLTLRLVYNGRAVPAIEAHAGAADWPIADGAEAPRPQDVHLTADAQGAFRLPITRAGLWNIRTIYVVPGAARSGADWDTHWATFVFQVGDAGSRGGMGAGPEQSSDSAAAVATVEQFHRALVNGDSLGALGLMTEDVVVLESGGFENRAEFRSHHLGADIEFARATRSERQVRGVTVRGGAAWVSSTSSVQGEFRGRTVNSMGAELVVLVRTPAGWRISAIHWSSRARRS
jgi:ketosteroid isomerase-like protein